MTLEIEPSDPFPGISLSFLQLFEAWTYVVKTITDQLEGRVDGGNRVLSSHDQNHRPFSTSRPSDSSLANRTPFTFNSDDRENLANESMDDTLDVFGWWTQDQAEGAAALTL
jgi:hypothetical protein